MEKRQEDKALLGLGTLCVVSNEKDKAKVQGKDVSICRPELFPALVHISQPTQISISPERQK